MRLVHIQDNALAIRWTWLPFWLAVNPALKRIEEELRDACLLQGITTSEADLDRLHLFVARRLQERFSGLPGLGSYLWGLSAVQEPS